jgi:hypothetical protein
MCRGSSGGGRDGCGLGEFNQEMVAYDGRFFIGYMSNNMNF